MKSRTVCWSVGLVLLGPLVARSEIHQPDLIAPIQSDRDSYYSQGSSIPGEQEPTPFYYANSESLPEKSNELFESPPAPAGGDCYCDSCQCDCCSSGCGGGGCGLLGPCCLGDAYKLRDCVLGECCWLDFGGWSQIGYYTDNDRMSTAFGDLLSFNDVPDGIRLDQQWTWFEKAAEAGECYGDWGFRFDIVYGTDAQKTQSFGNDDARWDHADSFDHGIYGWAMPQAYLQYAYGDWSIKAGHFFTLVGYEVIPAPDNFFYTHSYTMFNSEPFTHTGVLAAYSGFEKITFHMGWVLGWDTGFDQAFGGSAVHAGFITDLTDDVNLSYMMTGGDFGRRSAGTDGYSHSIVLNFTLSEKMNYVFQSDYYQSNGSFDDPTAELEEKGVNQYLFYTLNDCWALGMRAEWWKSNAFTALEQSYYEVTWGVNYKPHANVILRPEVKTNWTPGEVAFANANDGVDFDNTLFAVDCIFTF